MRNRNFVTLLACTLILASTAAAQQTQTAALVVDNRTSSAVDVQAWRYDGNHWYWVNVGRIQPNHSVSITPVKTNDRFRVLLPGGQIQLHTVALKNDKDTWKLISQG
jgi:hypothetical protein